jgi:hypothetical protein
VIGVNAWPVGFAFPITAMSRDDGDSGDFAALCLYPSATPPPGVGVLLITKAQPHFDRAVTERSEDLFPVFQRLNLAQFQPSFSVFTVRSAEGRKSL